MQDFSQTRQFRNHFTHTSHLPVPQPLYTHTRVLDVRPNHAEVAYSQQPLLPARLRAQGRAGIAEADRWLKQRMQQRQSRMRKGLQQERQEREGEEEEGGENWGS